MTKVVLKTRRDLWLIQKEEKGAQVRYTKPDIESQIEEDHQPGYKVVQVF